MTTLIIDEKTSVKGKHQVKVSDRTVLSGSGIKKRRKLFGLNLYFATYEAIETLKTKYICLIIKKP